VTILLVGWKMYGHGKNSVELSGEGIGKDIVFADTDSRIRSLVFKRVEEWKCEWIDTYQILSVWEGMYTWNKLW
jgi:hypothetical protein